MPPQPAVGVPTPGLRPTVPLSKGALATEPVPNEHMTIGLLMDCDVEM